MNGDKNSYYFTHDIGARNDTKIMRLLRLHGYEGYGWYWAIIEVMAQAKNYEITEEDTRDIAWEFRVSDETMQKFFRDLNEIGLVTIEGGYISSPSLRRRMETLEINRLARVERARKAGKASADARSTEDEQKRNTSSTQVQPRDREIEERAREIYDRYKQLIRAGAKQDAIKNIATQLGEYTPEELVACVEAYAANVKRNKTEEQYRIQANNFFGLKARFKDYLPTEQKAPAQAPPINPDLPPHLRGTI